MAGASALEQRVSALEDRVAAAVRQAAAGSLAGQAAQTAVSALEWRVNKVRCTSAMHGPLEHCADAREGVMCSRRSCMQCGANGQSHPAISNLRAGAGRAAPLDHSWRSIHEA